MTGDLYVNPASLDDAGAALRQLSTDLQAGQVDMFLLDWAAPPRNQPDVARVMRTFAEFADDQYQDGVALLAALSTRVAAAGDAYAQTDEAATDQMNKYLLNSTFQSADQRPG